LVAAELKESKGRNLNKFSIVTDQCKHALKGMGEEFCREIPPPRIERALP